jgi:hypothetical protein
MPELPQPTKNKVPPWVGTFFRDSYDSFERLMGVIHLSRRSIAGMRAMPRLKKALAAVQGKVQDEVEAQRVEKDAQLAQSEVENGFPVLHTFAVVALWSWLEHTIKGILVEHISRNPRTLKSGAFPKLKIKLGDYVALTKREQASYIVDLLEQETSSPLKQGINRFEILLDPLGLAGATPDNVTRQIYELQQVRNVIVHQNGRCDRRLRASCPWLKVKLGNQVTVSAPQLDLYAVAVSDYALEVLYRIGDSHGVDLRPSAANDT